MKKSLVLALAALLTQVTFAADIALARPANAGVPKIKLTIDVIHEDAQVSSFTVLTNPLLPMALRIHAGYDMSEYEHLGFEGVGFDVMPVVTNDRRIQLTIEAEKSEFKNGPFKSYTVGKNIVNVPQRPEFSMLSQTVVLENDQKISLPFGANTLNIHAKFEEVGGVNE